MEKASPATGSRPAPAAPARTSSRDRYLDLLRAIALVRVVAYHSFASAVWLSVAFPSMGVMFALAGSLMARSLERPALGVLRSRTRRLLLPLWVYSATVLVLLLWQGWNPLVRVGGSWLQTLLWFVPLGDPPFPPNIGSDAGLVESSWAFQAEEGLWYIRAYFWFMLLSPLLLKAFHRLPWATLLAPLGIMAILSMGFIPLPNWGNSGITDFATYGSCWVLGFAHYNGLLLGMSRRVVFTAGIVLMALGLVWAANHLDENGWDLNNIPLAQALWSLGFCAMLLRISPSWRALPRQIRFLDKAVTLINNRAITIYLWHNLLLVVTVVVINRLYELDAVAAAIPWILDSEWTQFFAVWLVLAIMFLTIGWVEDIAAERSPQLWPTGSPQRPPAIARSFFRSQWKPHFHGQTADSRHLPAEGEHPAGSPGIDEAPITSGDLTVTALGHQPGPVYVYKCTLQAGPDALRPEPRAHEGRDWIHVLNGRLRVVLGDQDMILTSGQSVEIDGKTPHWFGRQGTNPVEYVQICGEHGKTVHFSTRATRV
ncbi:acyltransferase family protein [Arthrobacter globiformis]|uniref:acyltransferase family protein n=1 Tax=Arthrobacter globiformis TaxID=1665 RepID=UPI0027D84874|nr:acyltransferase family protein [Arthrobacter globiformis]